MGDSISQAGVTAIVCCHNSAAVITPTLKALSRQEIPSACGYEVILVDNNCSDETVELARQAWQGMGFPLRIEREDTPGLIHARKRGVAAARYDVVMFVDDDNALAPDWVVKIRALFRERPDVGIIGGRNIADIQGAKPWWFDRFESMYACGPRAEAAALNPKKNFGAGLAFRTPLIRSVLFSELPLFLTGRTGAQLTLGEDSEMVMRSQLLGWDFFYDPSLILRHRILGKRLQWAYLKELAGEGGKAWILLHIYQRLLEKKEPLTGGLLFWEILGRWLRFIKKHRWKIFTKAGEGAWSSIGYARLLGMKRGWWQTKGRYMAIRKQIMNHFAPTADKG